MAGTERDEISELLAQGARLYNEGEFWEAHEAWEEAWHALRDGGRSEAAEYVQGLILATAALENLRRGKPRGFSTQGAKALHRLREHEGLGEQLGIVQEQGFTEALLDLYLHVQRRKITDLEGLERDPPALEVSP